MTKISGLSPDTAPTLDDEIASYEHGSVTTRRTTLGAVQDLFEANPATPAAGTYGWDSFPTSLAFNATTGNGEYVLDAGLTLTNLLSPGMKIRLDRTTAPSSQCATFTSSSSQYAAKATPAGLTLSTTLTIEAWVNMASYPASGVREIISGGVTGTNGFQLYLDQSGIPVIVAFKDGSNYRARSAWQGVKLNKWYHIAATVNAASGDVHIYMNAVDQPSLYNSDVGTGSTITTPTGSVYLSRDSGGSNYFDGKMSDVRIWNTIRTATQIRQNKDKALVGNESGLVSYWKLNGAWTDSTTSANTLTPSGSPVNNTVDNPHHSTEYFIVTKVSGTQVTVTGGSHFTFPNASVQNIYYSNTKSPINWPGEVEKWTIFYIDASTPVQNSAVTGTYYNPNYIGLQVPIGTWHLSFECTLGIGAVVPIDGLVGLSTATNAVTDLELMCYNATNVRQDAPQFRRKQLTIAADTNYYLIFGTPGGGASASLVLRGTPSSPAGPTVIKAECGYL